MLKLTSHILSFASKIGWIWSIYLLMLFFATFAEWFGGDFWRGLQQFNVLLWAAIAFWQSIDRDKWKKAAVYFAEEAGKWQALATFLSNRGGNNAE